MEQANVTMSWTFHGRRQLLVAHWCQVCLFYRTRNALVPWFIHKNKQSRNSCIGPSLGEWLLIHSEWDIWLLGTCLAVPASLFTLSQVSRLLGSDYRAWMTPMIHFNQLQSASSCCLDSGSSEAAACCLVSCLRCFWLPRIKELFCLAVKPQWGPKGQI